MAELALKIGAGANYESGDVLCAFTRRHVRCVYAEHLCLPKFQVGKDVRLDGMDLNGIMPEGHLSRDWCEVTQELRLERLSKHEAQLVRIADGETIRFRSNEPFVQFDGRTVAMDLELFCRRKRQAPLFPVFGRVRGEIIYGGRVDYSDAKLTNVWQAIHEKTGKRDTDEQHKHWPAGQQDLKSHLFVPVGDDLDDDDASHIVRQVLDAQGELLQKRAMRADNWKKIAAKLKVREQDVEDRTKPIDKRKDVEPLTDVDLLRDKVEKKTKNHKGR